MATPGAIKRLTKEYKNLKNSPVDLIETHPTESDILNWYYVITGPPGTVYEGGQYLGQLKFHPTYPFKPPSIMMITPSGRFQPNTRLCLSVSDFHPELWNPAWNVGTILTGLLSFMTSEEVTAGGIRTSPAQKKEYAKVSKAFNAAHPAFRKEFPSLLNSGQAPPANEPKEEPAKKTEAVKRTRAPIPTKSKNDEILKEVFKTASLTNTNRCSSPVSIKAQELLKPNSSRKRNRVPEYVDLDDEIEVFEKVGSKKSKLSITEAQVINLDDESVITENDSGIYSNNADDPEVYIID